VPSPDETGLGTRRRSGHGERNQRHRYTDDPVHDCFLSASPQYTGITAVGSSDLRATRRRARAPDKQGGGALA
jgi:hypothetical protein